MSLGGETGPPHFARLLALPHMLRECIKSGNRAACRKVLKDATPHQLAQLMLQVGRAGNINDVTWAQAVFHNRGFLDQTRMQEIDETRSRIKKILQEIATVAGEQMMKKNAPAMWKTGALATTRRV
jgi:hypothetical protein